MPFFMEEIHQCILRLVMPEMLRDDAAADLSAVKLQFFLFNKFRFEKPLPRCQVSKTWQNMLVYLNFLIKRNRFGVSCYSGKLRN